MKYNEKKQNYTLFRLPEIPGRSITIGSILLILLANSALLLSIEQQLPNLQ